MDKRRKKIKKKIDDEEMEILRGDKDIDESLLEVQINGGKGEQRIQSSNAPKRDPQKMQQGQNFYKGAGDDDDDDINELEGDDDEEEEEEGLYHYKYI